MKAKWANSLANGAGSIPDDEVKTLAQETFDRGLELEDVLEGEEFSAVANTIARIGWVPTMAPEEQEDMDFEESGGVGFDDADADDSQMDMDMDEDEGYF